MPRTAVRRSLLRLVVVLQVFLLVTSLIAPVAALAEEPSADPSPSAPPSAEPSAEPTPEATPEPTAEATPEATPNEEPSSDPTAEPTPEATPDATPATPAPTPEPTPEPMPAAPIAAPTIASDLDDYPPGGLVTLTGSNWQPGEVVHIFVNDDWGSSWSRNGDVTADAHGNITDQFNLPNWFVAHYGVAATGPASGMAITTFTDSRPASASLELFKANCTTPATTFGPSETVCVKSTVVVESQGNQAYRVQWQGPTSTPPESVHALSASGTVIFTDTLVPGEQGSWTVRGCGSAQCTGSNLLDSETFTVGKAATTTTVTCSAGPFSYTGSEYTPCTATVTGSGGLNQSLTVSYTNNVNVGTATASASFAENASYLGSSNSADFDIDPATLFVNAQPASKTFGQDDPPFTYELSGFVNDEDADSANVSGDADCTREPGEDAGTYLITCAPGTLAAPNYVLQTGTTANLTINQAIATCTITGYSGTYDGLPHGATGTCTGVGGGALPGLDRGASFTNVPGGTANWSFEGGTNYTGQSGSVLIDIDPATLEVDAVADSKTYGDDDPAFIYELSGFVNDEDADEAGVTGDADCTREPGEDVGTYQITCEPGNLAAPNYVFVTGDSADFDIDPATLTVTADDKDRSFGVANPPLTYQITGFVNGETLATSGVTGTPGLSTAATAMSPAGMYPISVTIGSLMASNYDFSFANGTLTVHQYQVVGFSKPVDNMPILNVAKAGQAIPLKFRVLDYLGQPVVGLPFMQTITGSMTCLGTLPTDLIEEVASGSSGLQNLGDGYYQFNWKTDTKYANSCRTFAVKLGDGASTYLQATFQFKK